MLFILLIAIAVVAVALWLRHPQYAAPKVTFTADTPNYRNGQFYNDPQYAPRTPSPGTTTSRWALWYQFLFGKDPGSIPAQPLPAQKTDLLQLDPQRNVIIWMGHSSYFIQLNGLRFLVDPVFSRSASPVPGTNRAFAGSTVYQAADIPAIDYLLISHDHWDHLDYPSIKALGDKIRHIVTPLGVGAYFRRWGFPADRISEGNWFSVVSGPGAKIHILPTRHFSGRLLERNQTLWGSFALQTPDRRIYLGGDSGYGRHFAAIYQHLGPVDVAILECGQYDANWASIHMTPEQTAQAADDLHAGALFPGHNSKFKLAHHPWRDPLERISHIAESKPWRLLTPYIGQTVALDDPRQSFTPWWRQLP
ncbi:MBL fold metallo-hydrolase [Shimwellia pseudoproteus]|uniref:MBL fold metallo-hydrolase n=1 Tax=Shimwellia pseudoproteus TaxID=570012 RepID=UPI0018ED28AC|nr:MBL fold metallo-hydrolase [Shimwellia pseudoproteus]MBJ3816115.1 MBL fold metallo-hydrolase [Shimwellia pseudoproteus]